LIIIGRPAVGLSLVNYLLLISFRMYVLESGSWCYEHVVIVYAVSDTETDVIIAKIRLYHSYITQIIQLSLSVYVFLIVW